MTHTKFLAEHVGRAVAGAVWHAQSLDAMLADVTAEEARMRPIPNVHTIGELVGHIAAWAGECERRLSDGPKTTLSATENFPEVDTSSEKAWQSAVQLMRDRHASLSRAIEQLDETRLHAKLPHRSHSAAFMLHGLVEHDAYHGGQIALLKKMIRSN